MNALMEQQLQACVNYLQVNWTDYLFLVEFAGNNQISDTATLSAFFANLDYHPLRLRTRHSRRRPGIAARPDRSRAPAPDPRSSHERDADAQAREQDNADA